MRSKACHKEAQAFTRCNSSPQIKKKRKDQSERNHWLDDLFKGVENTGIVDANKTISITLRVERLGCG